MSVNLNLISYTATNAQSLADIQKGDVGQITNKVLDGQTLTITTTKGVFTFSAPELDSPDNVKAGDINDALGKFQNVLSNSDQMLSDIYQVMALFAQVAKEQRSSSREVRSMERNLQQQEIQQQVKDLKSAAATAMAMGIVAGALQIAGGAVQLGFAGSASKAGTDALANAALGKGQAWASIFGGTGGMFNAIGQGVSGLKQADATQHQANAAKLDSQAQESTDYMNAMRDLLRDVMEKLQSIQQSQSDTMKTILRA